MRILVTGGAGLIGANFLHALSRASRIGPGTIYAMRSMRPRCAPSAGGPPGDTGDGAQEDGARVS